MSELRTKILVHDKELEKLKTHNAKLAKTAPAHRSIYGYFIRFLAEIETLGIDNFERPVHNIEYDTQGYLLYVPLCASTSTWN